MCWEEALRLIKGNFFFLQYIKSKNNNHFTKIILIRIKNYTNKNRLLCSRRLVFFFFSFTKQLKWHAIDCRHFKKKTEIVKDKNKKNHWPVGSLKNLNKIRRCFKSSAENQKINKFSYRRVLRNYTNGIYLEIVTKKRKNSPAAW